MRKNKLDIRPNELSKDTKTSMKTRIISAIVGLLIIIPPIILGDWFFLALILAATIIANYEIVHCCEGQRSFWLYLTTITIGVLMVNWPIFKGLIDDVASGHAFEYFKTLNISLILLFVGISILFTVVILHPSFTVKDGFYIISMVLIISVGLQSMLLVRFIPSAISGASRDSWFNSFDNFESCSLMVYGILGTFATDAGAYFVGVFFGKHKLNERISPKKTVEGFVGGIVISAAVTMAFAFILSANGHPILKGVFDLDRWFNIVALSLLMPLFATLGDLIFSAIKRSINVKDFGHVIPGHGGILDRLDSLTFVFACVAMYTLLYYGISSGSGLLV